MLQKSRHIDISWANMHRWLSKWQISLRAGLIQNFRVFSESVRRHTGIAKQSLLPGEYLCYTELVIKLTVPRILQHRLAQGRMIKRSRFFSSFILKRFGSEHMYEIQIGTYKNWDREYIIHILQYYKMVVARFSLSLNIMFIGLISVHEQF